MEIRNGYKMTELGLFPEDWEIKLLGDIGFFSKGRGIKKDEAASGNIPCIRYGEIYTRHNDYIKKFFSFISGNIAKTSKKINKGDILFAGSGETKEEIGKSVAFVDEFEAYAGGDIVIMSPNDVNSLFLGYLLNSKKIQKQKANNGQGDAIVHIHAHHLEKISIPLPPLEEQQSIAEVLSDTDNLIQALEKQIAKKRLIKQGLMQKLLTPKEGWEVRQLGEIAKTYGGLSGKTRDDFQNGVFPYIPFLNILTNPIIDTANFDYVNIGNSEAQNKALKGDLFFNGSSETPEEVGMCSVLLDDIENLYLNSFCFGLRLFDQSEFDALYLSYFFRSGEGRKLLFSLAQGATRYNLSKTNFLKLKVAIPRIEEQILIAKIIRDMDAEITALSEKHHKQILLKQGLMQNLLTGKIRLVTKTK